MKRGKKTTVSKESIKKMMDKETKLKFDKELVYVKPFKVRLLRVESSPEQIPKTINCRKNPKCSKYLRTTYPPILTGRVKTLLYHLNNLISEIGQTGSRGKSSWKIETS